MNSDKIKILVVLACMMLLAVKTNAQNNLQRLDSLVNDLYQRNELSGNVLVASKGQLVYKHSHGSADVADGKLNSDSFAFKLA